MNFNPEKYKERYADVDFPPYKQYIKDDKCDFIGFRPLSVRIKEMKAKGELNELLMSLENQDITLDSLFRHNQDIEASDKPISVMNIKGLDKVELNKMLLDRAKSYHQKVSEFQKSLNSFRGLMPDQQSALSEPPHTASNAEAVATDDK